MNPSPIKGDIVQQIQINLTIVIRASPHFHVMGSISYVVYHSVRCSGRLQVARRVRSLSWVSSLTSMSVNENHDFSRLGDKTPNLAFQSSLDDLRFLHVRHVVLTVKTQLQLKQ